MKVREVMTENVHCCRTQTSVAATTQILLTDVMACYRKAAGTQAQSVSCHDIVEAYGGICELRKDAGQKKRLSLVARA